MIYRRIPKLESLSEVSDTTAIVPYEFSAEYIIDKLSAYSIRDDNRKIPIDCGKCHVKHDVTILLTLIPTI